MSRTNRTTLTLIPSEETSRSAQIPIVDGSAVVIQVKRGRLCNNVVKALTPEDASALLNGLAMAIVQVLHAQQTL